MQVSVVSSCKQQREAVKRAPLKQLEPIFKTLNTLGNTKWRLSHEGRITFVENHLDDIFDSADRPLEGRRWWLEAEDPFQCLAACINLFEALRCHSPETTISHMPVYQDGSCNGLQHYAALSKDKLGAAAVNLVGGD
ncbi:hypothetical protein K1719_027843 [Acacia pycnantha]|nr:hypothetical protein K1719_027843 [Acacia pycnantha]